MPPYPPGPFVRWVLREGNEAIPNLYIGNGVRDHELPPEFVALVEQLLREGSLEEATKGGMGSAIPSRVFDHLVRSPPLPLTSR